MLKRGLNYWIAVLFLFLLVNTAYIASFPAATIFYMGNVLVHLVLGFVLAMAVALTMAIGRERVLPKLALVFFAVALFAGGYLTWVGNIRENRWILWTHMLSAGLGVAALIPFAWRASRSTQFQRAFAACLALLLTLPAIGSGNRGLFPRASDRVRNPLHVPASMQEEGGGPASPFFPSSAKTNVGGIIPSNFFMDSEVCGECHKDIYEQWKGSAHHFASFNNQFYRKSIEYMQSVVGTQPSKWCAGCHDHAVFFNGRFDKPIAEQIDTPEAQAGLACTSCHAITHVDGSMGNGGFTIEYPPLHQLLASRNKVIRSLDRFLTYLNPEPHRKTFLKPFMTGDSADFCSACHKVHLDVPVNNYRWFRGFNDYDNWQASGVSGKGARSFYYPKEFSVCADCHMPLVASRDPGNRNGKIHSHRFPAANTALAYVNADRDQMQAEEQFLKSGFISVDIFAASPVNPSKGETAMVRRSGEGQQLMSTFAVGEEAEQAHDVVIREESRRAAPLDKAGPVLRPGSVARVDVVVRTRKIGHFFPGGTVDAFDVWLELQARDADGKVIFWSGRVAEDGRGPVEGGAHFYKSYQLDAEGNPINKRNAWQARSVLYVRLIPPGAADVAHYRVRIPKHSKGPITLTAKLNHRKFSHYYTQFAYAGRPVAGQAPSKVSWDHDSREFSFVRAGIPANVSGKIKDHIPELPITVLAQAEAKLVLGSDRTTTDWKTVVEKADRERWNDWGIGLLLQGDVKGAEYAFRKVTEAEPGYADGWLNVARALIQEGETEAAKPYVARALKLNPELGRIHFFQAMIQKADGDYDGALASLQITESKYPEDRVVLNQIARILFLQRNYAEAIRVLERVSSVDPEDLQMHYNKMLCYRGLGDADNAASEQKLFARFKAEESAQAITAKPRLLSPEDNNERQQIHDHESVPLTGATAMPATVTRDLAVLRVRAQSKHTSNE
jgi:Flp pilus assembly protein TadD